MTHTTWSEILTGDVVLGHDGAPYLVQRRGGHLYRNDPRYALFNPGRPGVVTGNPSPDTPVTRLQSGSANVAVATLRAQFPDLSIVDDGVT